MLRGNRTERRDTENKALAFRAETVSNQIANLEGILQRLKEHHRKVNKKEGSSLTHERTQDCHHRDSYMNLQVLAPLMQNQFLAKL